MSDNEIGRKILNRRKALGLTLENVGDAVGVGKSTVRKWENGMIKNMGRDKIAALAAVLQMDPVEFVPGPSKPKDPIEYVRLKVNRKSFTNAMLKKTVVHHPEDYLQIIQKTGSTKVEFKDPQTKSMMKLWEVSTPETKKAVMGVLKAMNKPTTKE